MMACSISSGVAGLVGLGLFVGQGQALSHVLAAMGVAHRH
jgi:amino acid permease